MIDLSYRRRLLGSSMFAGAAIVAATALMAAPAMAQEADDDQVDDIVITGSRIARQDYVSNSPTVTVAQEDFQATGSVTIDTLLNDLPQLVPSFNGTSNNPSNGGQANANLRGLGVTRTLVLTNGRRVIPSNSSGVVDINIIPTAMIENIEIITGGASATYGSDAIAGVVNFILKDDFEGLQFDSQYGVTDQEDGETESYSLTMGGNFADDRGNATLSVGYSKRASIFNAARPFSSVSGASGTSPLGSTVFDAANAPSQAFINGIFGAPTVCPTAASPTGPCVANTGQFGFNDNGSLFSYALTRNFQSPGGIDYDGFARPGTGDYAYNTGPLNLLQLPLERYNIFGSGNFEINKNAEVYIQALFTQYESRNTLAATPAANNVPGTGFRVPSTNPFISPILRSFLNARPNPAGSFLLNKRFNEVGGRTGSENYDVYQITTGIRGDIGFRDWSYDFYGQYGRVDNLTTQTGNVSRSAVQTLLDAPDGGVSRCAGGFDPFGISSLSPQCAAFISRASKNSTMSEQRVLEGVVQGGLFELPAGEVRFAAGLTYREDSFAFTPDALLAQSNPVVTRPDGGQTGGSEIAGFNPTQALAGRIDVYEFFGEALIPLIADVPFIQELNLTLAGRFSDYSSIDSVVSYKADADWVVFDGLRVRGGYQRAVRAPTIGELFAPLNTNFPAIGAPLASGAPAFGGDPCDVRGAYRAASNPNRAAVRALCIAQGVSATAIDSYQFTNNQVSGVTGGNPNLEEETADTYNVGIVYQPGFSADLLSDMSFSLDYYTIEIADVIGTVTANEQLRGCFNAAGGNPTYDASNGFCTLFQRDPLSGNIVNARELNGNLAALKTSGIDAQFDWEFDVAALGLSDWGRIDLNVVAGWLENYERQTVAGGLFIDRTGTIDSALLNSSASFPEWKVLTSLGWTVGDFSIGTRWRRVGELTQFGNAAVELDAVDYFDANVGWNVNDTVSLRAGINNISDEQPNTFSPGVQANTDPSTYDVLGRRYYVGLTARF